MFAKSVSVLLNRVCLIAHKNICTFINLKSWKYNNLKIWTSNSIQYTQVRFYAKGKDKMGKDKEKGKKSGKVEINNAQLSEVLNIELLNGQMQKCVDVLKEEFVKNVSLRSSTGSIETIPVSLDGKDYELQELAQITRKNPKTLVINMVSFPQAIPAVLQSILKSGMNLNPQQDGTTIFIPVPKVTREHRENLAKNAKSLFIKCRDSIKDVQNNTIRKVKKHEHIASDMVHSVQNQIVALGETYISQAEKMLDNKHSELLGKD